MEVTDINFEREVLKSEMPVMVDFWAAWSGSSRMLSPVVDEFTREFIGKFKVLRLDVDANPNTTNRFAICSIPSLLFFKQGRLVEQIIGPCTKSKLSAIALEVLQAE